MRINARLDTDHSKKLEELRKRCNSSVSDIVKEAIDLMYAQQTDASKKKIEALLKSDFIGCGQGPKDLSENHKDYLTQSLGNKHDSYG